MQAEIAKREELIALSRQHFGEITGAMTLGFPGWKCRWDYIPGTGKTQKTFIAADGREWKVLKDIECMFGRRIEQGRLGEVKAMVDVGAANTVAHELFSVGHQRAKETQGSCLIVPEEGTVAEAKGRKKRAARMEERGSKRTKRKKRDHKNYLGTFPDLVYPAQEGWAALASEQDLHKGFAESRSLHGDYCGARCFNN